MTAQLSRLSAYLSFYCGSNHLVENDTAISVSFNLISHRWKFTLKHVFYFTTCKR